MGAWAANVAGVLLVLVLLGIEVWVVAIALLASVVAPESITRSGLVRAGLAATVSALAFVGIAIAVGWLLVP